MNKIVAICTQSQMNENGPSMESAVSFAPLRPADFIDFAGRGGAGHGLLFAGRGGGGICPRSCFD